MKDSAIWGPLSIIGVSSRDSRVLNFKRLWRICWRGSCNTQTHTHTLHYILWFWYCFSFWSPVSVIVCVGAHSTIITIMINFILHWNAICHWRTLWRPIQKLRMSETQLWEIVMIGRWTFQGGLLSQDDYIGGFMSQAFHTNLDGLMDG